MSSPQVFMMTVMIISVDHDNDKDDGGIYEVNDWTSNDGTMSSPQASLLKRLASNTGDYKKAVDQIVYDHSMIIVWS